MRSDPIGSCASYSKPAKLMACGLVALVAITGWRAWDHLAGEALQWQRLALVAAFVWLVACLVSIMRARTTVDAKGIRQSGLGGRRVAFIQVTHIKLVHVPALDWLVAPRLVVKLKGGGTATFRAADVRLLRVLVAESECNGAAQRH